MKQRNTKTQSRMRLWLLIPGALWLVLTLALQFAGGGAQRAYAQQNTPDPTPNVEATNTPAPTPTESTCEYTP